MSERLPTERVREIAEKFWTGRATITMEEAESLAAEVLALREERAAIERGCRKIRDTMASHEMFPALCGALDCLLDGGKIPMSWRSPASPEGVDSDGR